MKKWSELFHEPVSPQYSDRVLSAAQLEMTQSLGAAKSSRSTSRWAFISTLTLAALAAVFVFRRESRPHHDEIELLQHEHEMLTDADLFSDLETLEEWDGESDGEKQNE